MAIDNASSAVPTAPSATDAQSPLSMADFRSAADSSSDTPSDQRWPETSLPGRPKPNHPSLGSCLAFARLDDAVGQPAEEVVGDEGASGPVGAGRDRHRGFSFCSANG
jgi:hypothetical protein